MTRRWTTWMLAALTMPLLAQAGGAADDTRDEYIFEGQFRCSATALIITGSCEKVIQFLEAEYTDLPYMGGPEYPVPIKKDEGAWVFRVNPDWQQLTVRIHWDRNIGMDPGMSFNVEQTTKTAGHANYRYARVHGDTGTNVTLFPGVVHPSADVDEETGGQYAISPDGELLMVRAFRTGFAHNPAGTEFLGLGADVGHRFTATVVVQY